MGICHSDDSKNSSPPTPAKVQRKVSQPLSIQQRLACRPTSLESGSFTLSNRQAKYIAALYPGFAAAERKQCQDRYLYTQIALRKPKKRSKSLEKKDAEEPCYHLFCVFDGHGAFGDKVAEYLMRELPLCLEKLIQEGHSHLLQRTLSTAFVMTDKKLKKESGIDTFLSGSTGTCLLIAKDTCYVAHVGDSRAVLGYLDPSMPRRPKETFLQAIGAPSTIEIPKHVASSVPLPLVPPPPILEMSPSDADSLLAESGSATPDWSGQILQPAPSSTANSLDASLSLPPQMASTPYISALPTEPSNVSEISLSVSDSSSASAGSSTNPMRPMRLFSEPSMQLAAFGGKHESQSVDDIGYSVGPRVLSDAEARMERMKQRANEAHAFQRTGCLSRDLTPAHNLKDLGEKKRVEKAGGRVDTLRNSYGAAMGPPRVFEPGSAGPGLAVSRSFGDAQAHRVGVTAEPSIYYFDLKSEHQFLIIASDGVWDQMTSQEAVSRVYLANGAENTCETVILKCAERWIDANFGLSDDISMIVIFLPDSDALQNNM